MLSPRLELGISRVSGGRINQLSHESAIRLRTLIGTAASGWLCPCRARALVVAVATGAGTDRGRRHAGRVGSTLALRMQCQLRAPAACTVCGHMP